MPRRLFRRVSGGYLRNEHPWVLHPFRTMISHPTFFAVSRRSVAGAIWIGVFVALLPVPGQTVIALLVALLLRVNLPIAAIATWITNPLTIVPFFYWEYRLGSLILGIPVGQFEIELSWEWVTTGFLMVWKPLLLGSFISATVVASLTYVVISVAWRWFVGYRYRRRHINGMP